MFKLHIFIIIGLLFLVVEFRADYSKIIPGTKWCGDGDIAQNYSDLGRYVKTDTCCRAHDLCPDIMKAGTSKNGLTNTGNYTRLNCQCDGQFYSCLKKAQDGLATLVLLYFEYLGQKCYAFRSPAICTSYNKDKNGCLRYKYNTSLPKVWQWFDVLYYTVT